MPDIFDEIETTPAAMQGDVFDQLEAQPQVQDSTPEWAGRHPNAYGAVGAVKETGESLGKAAMNTPRSAYDMGKNIVTAVTSPIQTAKALGNVALGGVEKIIPGEQGSEATFDALTQFYKDRYGSTDNLRKTLEEDPVGLASDLATFFTAAGGTAKGLGALSKSQKLSTVGKTLTQAGNVADPVNAAIHAGKPIVGAATKQVGKLGSELLGKTTGGGAEAVRQAYKGSDSFKSALRGNVTGEQILDTAQDALQSVRKDRAAAYSSRLDEIAKNTSSLDINPVKKKLDDLLKAYNVKTTTEGTLDFSRSTVGKNAVNEVTEIVDIVKGWGSQADDLTPKMVDVLKRRLDDFYSDSKNSRAMVASLRNEVRNVLVKNVPNYEKMTADYAKTTELVKEVERALSLNKRSAADTALRKLMTTMRENFEFRKSLLDKLENASGTDIQGQIAGATLNKPLPRGLLGSSLGTAGIIAAAFTNPSLLGLFAISSPRLVGEFTNMLGNMSRIGKPVAKAAEKAASKSTVLRQGLYQAGRINEVTK